MIAIQHGILHIFDFKSGACVYADQEVNFREEKTFDFLQRHLESSFKSPDQKQGQFKEESRFYSILLRYKKEEMDFVAFSREVGELVHGQLNRLPLEEVLDLLVVDFKENEVRHCGIFLLKSRPAYTHHVNTEAGGITNEIILHHAILPSISQKIESFGIVNMQSLEVGFVDKEREMEGRTLLLLPEYILQCSAKVSSKEAVALVKKVSTKIAEEHGKNPALVVAKAKKYISENAEFSTTISPVELAAEVFGDSQEMQEEFKRGIGDGGFSSEVTIDRNYALRTGKSHKIKTDTGIELSFPAEYFENPEFIEFINNPNGTISISLKNIGKIVNR